MHLYPFAPRDELVMLGLAACPLGSVAGEQDRDGVKVRASEAS